MKSFIGNKFTQTALVVDDEPMVRLLARETLEQAGFLVDEAENGTQALAYLEKTMPDLVMLDVMMPDIDGFQVCRHLHGIADNQSCAVVMMTGLDDYASIQQAYDAGATDFIIKPINWQVLGYRVKYIARANQAFKDLHASETMLKHAQQIARLGNWEWEVADDRFRVSETIPQILSIQEDKRFDSFQSLLALIHPQDREHVQTAFEHTVKTSEPCGIDARIILVQGNERFIHIEAEPLTGKGSSVLFLTGTMQDITERKLSENKILSLAYFDNLTGLANRLQFSEYLEQAIQHAQTEHNSMALLFMDLDRFKTINDTLGHDAGDLLLKEIAKRLKHCLRKDDCVSRDATSQGFQTVSRLGGDEFTIILQNIFSCEGAAKVARRIITEIEHPIILNGHEVFVTASIGISMYPDDGANSISLIKNADAAMYHSKSLGGNTYQFYTNSMNASAMERLALESDLRKAIERNEFELYYQPQVTADNGTISAVEALIRWRHPERGHLLPGLFIPLAEESGLITAIDRWVLTTACRQIKAWESEGISSFRVAINLSGRDFQQNKLLEMAREALAATGINPAHLELELTEGVLMKNAEETIETLNALKRMGLALTIDDFGTGYSSLSYLKRFPIDSLKIDKSFVADVTSDSNNAAIVTAIIAMARKLNINVIAEGVETEEQRLFLQNNGCSDMQGYLFGRPVDLSTISDMLAGRTPLSVAPAFSGDPARSGAAPCIITS